ncbi:DUF1643 domain-containing protein [Leptolyngbya sp. FACHB-36]|uniref:DUF1643 domain-containing protein n=1 Tax=Leptolyngbya sp. FACHB-36 TaxID=2692808 RepID=UPI001681A404|nr:DUF1643 domain-containing protein [Leptolyngbya sp. FACHB-36]MBD2020646.1 DUF1643 domain-containing protein [Leptolyngbya sp. FACHB-36]
MQLGAVLDPTTTYRYSLWRSWNSDAPRIGFVMLNPSRADATVNDPTIRRCIRFAQTWNFGSLEVVNLFAYRTADPSTLRHVADPIGSENDRYLTAFGDRVACILLAWGNGGTLLGRDRAVLPLFAQRPVYCIGTTKLGQPRHPLYVRADVLYVQFAGNGES